MLASVHDLHQVGSFDRVLLMSKGRVLADDAPYKVLASTALSEAFRIEREGSGWRIRGAA